MPLERIPERTEHEVYDFKGKSVDRPELFPIPASKRFSPGFMFGAVVGFVFGYAIYQLVQFSQPSHQMGNKIVVKPAEVPDTAAKPILKPMSGTTRLVVPPTTLSADAGKDQKMEWSAFTQHFDPENSFLANPPVQATVDTNLERPANFFE